MKKRNKIGDKKIFCIQREKQKTLPAIVLLKTLRRQRPHARIVPGAPLTDHPNVRHSSTCEGSRWRGADQVAQKGAGNETLYRDIARSPRSRRVYRR